jgi:hypothetical protein
MNDIQRCRANRLNSNDTRALLIWIYQTGGVPSFCSFSIQVRWEKLTASSEELEMPYALLTTLGLPDSATLPPWFKPEFGKD